MKNMLFDYHLHSIHSPDGSMKMETILKRAQELGLAEICITDHVEVDNTFGDEWQTTKEKVQAQLDDMNRIKKMSNNFVKKGVELAFPDNDPGTVEDMCKLINPDDYDFSIISLHQYNGESPFSDSFYADRTLPEGAATYVKWINKRIRDFPLEYYDCVGHIDYVSKGTHGLDDPSLNLSFFKNELCELFCFLIDNGKTFEINTSAFRSLPSNKVHGLDWLTLFAQMGGEFVVIGSDAHREEFIGYRLEKALELIKEAGIPYVATYDKHYPTLHKIK